MQLNYFRLFRPTWWNRFKSEFEKMMRKMVFFYLIFFAVVVQAELPEDIVFLLTFDEIKGDEIIDLSGNGNHGLAVGKSKIEKGKFGDSFYFDGKTSITVKNAKPLGELTDPMSVGVWLKPDILGGWRNIVEMDGKTGWKFGFHDSKALVWTTYFVKDFITTQPVEDKEWSHVAATWNGKEAKMYINGEEVKGSPIAGGGVIDVKKEPSLDIGFRRTSADCYFEGFMDELFISNKVLTVNEIKKYQEGFDALLQVDPKSKLTTVWGSIKHQ